MACLFYLARGSEPSGKGGSSPYAAAPGTESGRMPTGNDDPSGGLPWIQGVPDEWRHRTPALWRRSRMKKYLLGVAFAALMSSYAQAENVAVSMARFDDNFLTVLRNGMIDYAQGAGRRKSAGRGRAERRCQAARPDQELRRFRRRRHHRQSGRHFSYAGDVGRRRGRQYSAGLRQPRAGQRRHAARQPGLRRLERKGFGHAGNEGGLPSVQGGRKDRSKRLRHHGRAVEPGRRAADRGYRRRDRDAGMLVHQDHRQADLELAARPGAEPDDQLAVDRLPSSMA